MKITADSLLGSAQKINNKRKLDESTLKNGNSGLKSDSVSISNKINSRVESISREIAQLQTSLSEKQIIREGLAQMQSGNLNEASVNELFSRTTFNNKKVLEQFMNGKSDQTTVQAKTAEIDKLINSDVNQIRKVQVEVDNFVASNLAGDKFDKLMSDTNSLLGAPGTDLNSISNLNAEKVMRLVQ